MFILACCSLRDCLGEGYRQSVGVNANRQFDPLAFSLRWRHHEPDAFLLQLRVGFVYVLDVKPN
jgi:hypothetical protein